MNGSDSPQNKRSYDLTGYYYDHKKLGKLDFRRISELFRSSKTANPFLTALRKKRTIPLPITIRSPDTKMLSQTKSGGKQIHNDNKHKVPQDSPWNSLDLRYKLNNKKVQEMEVSGISNLESKRSESQKSLETSRRGKRHITNSASVLILNKPQDRDNVVVGMKGNNGEHKRYGESEKVGSGEQIRGEYCVLGKSKNNNVNTINNMKNMKNIKNINKIEKHRRIMSSGVNSINTIDSIDSIRDSIDISSRRVENGVRRWEKSRKEESNDKTNKNTQVCSECKCLGVINKDKNKNDIPITQKVLPRQRIESPCTLSINNIISSKRYTNTNTNSNTNSNNNTHHHTHISPNRNRRLIPNNPQEQTTIHSNTIISPNPRSKRKEHKLQKSATQYINTRNQGLHTSTHRNLPNVGNLLGNHTNIRNNTNVGNLPNTTEGISTTTSHKFPPKGVNEEIRSSMQLTMHPRLSYYIRKVPLQPIYGMTTSTSITRSINMNTHNINIKTPQRSKTSLSTNTPVPAPHPTFDAYLNTLEDSFVLKTDSMQKLLQKVIISKDGSDPVVEEILSDGRLRYMKHLKEWNKIFRSSYYSQNYSENTKLEKLKEKLPSHTFLSELYMEHGLQREQNLWRECQTPHPTTSKLLNKNKKRTNSAAKHLLNNLIKNREGEMDNNSGDLLISGSQTISQNVLKSSMSSEKLKVLHENFIEDNEDINDTSIITPLHTVINNK